MFVEIKIVAECPNDFLGIVFVFYSDVVEFDKESF